MMIHTRKEVVPVFLPENTKFADVTVWYINTEFNDESGEEKEVLRSYKTTLNLSLIATLTPKTLKVGTRRGTREERKNWTSFKDIKNNGSRWYFYRDSFTVEMEKEVLEVEAISAHINIKGIRYITIN